MSKAVHEKYSCLIHPKGVKLLSVKNFYKASPSSIYGQSKMILICKDCCKRIFQDYYSKYNDVKQAVYNTCRKMDIAFVNSAYEASLREADGDWMRVFGLYMKNYNSLGIKNGWQYNFDNSESLDANAERIEQEKELKEASTKMNKSEKEAKKQIIELLDYDPFNQFNISDQKYLYKNLLEYFKDETVLEDNFKVSQIIQIVVNNNQIRIYNNEIARFTANTMENLGELKSLNSLVKDIVFNNDKIAKENGISEKNKKNKKSGANTLGSLMKTMRGLDFEDAEQDYYDMNKSYGIKHTLNISFEAITKQLNFGDADIDDLIQYQRDLIKKLQEKVMNLEEEIRIKLSCEDGENG